MNDNNVDRNVAEGFGDEWTRFDQSGLGKEQRDAIFLDYFRRFPWAALPSGAQGADFGCGSGRWALNVAPRVGHLHCIDASGEALSVARRNLAARSNVSYHHCSVENAPIAPRSLDFGYSLGVLHHIPRPFDGVAACGAYLKPGAPFLLYLYYRFDNRPFWYRWLWRASDVARRLISRMPMGVRYVFSQVAAALIYWPMARVARACQDLGLPASGMPLAYYADKSYYVMRTDALDRLGTRLEYRFTRQEMTEMMERAGFRDITYNDTAPYWCALGYRK